MSKKILPKTVWLGKKTFKNPILNMRVIDGDTVEVYIDRGFNDFKRLTVRFEGVDTPELNKPDQRIKAIEAKNKLQHFIDSGFNWELQTIKMDLYGRWLGVITSTTSNLNLNEEMKKYPKE